MIYEVFNAGAFTNSEQLAQAKKIPPDMVASYKRLIQQNPKTRLSVAHFLEQGSRSRAFFDTPLIHVAQFVENMGVKNQDEREEFLRELEETGDQFPEDFFKAKVLPELLKSVEFGGGKLRSTSRQSRTVLTGYCRRAKSFLGSLENRREALRRGMGVQHYALHCQAICRPGSSN